MDPVVLRHKDANRQALTYGAFGILVMSMVAVAVLAPLPGRWWYLVLAPIALFLLYSATRLATLRVRLDEQGIWEPNPFRLTHVTPWADVSHVRKCTNSGAVGLSFIGVEVVHADRETHEVVALKTQAGAAYAEPMLEEWLQAIRAFKKRVS